MNKKTRRARKLGYCSQRDMQEGGEKTFKGQNCDTSWKNPNSKKNTAKKYGRVRSSPGEED